MQAAAAAGLLALLPVAGCLPALREPPTLEELSQRVGRRSPPDKVDSLLFQADAAFSRRTERSVRRAADLSVEAGVADSGRKESWIGATRALVWLADHLPEKETRRQASRYAVDTGQWCDRASPDDAECHYWLAVALGIQARERRSTGLDAVPRIVELLKRAREREPALEQGGPDRVLALVYLRAPGWPTGPGDPDLGLEHSRRAVELFPEFPPNTLALAEALTEIEDPEASRAAYTRALEQARRSEKAGNPDAHEWVSEAEQALERLGRR